MTDQLHIGKDLHAALEAGIAHSKRDFYYAFKIERVGDWYYVTRDMPGYDADNVSWTYESGLEALGSWDDHSRLLETYESLETPAHYLYHLPYLGELKDGEAYIVFQFIASDISLERNEDGHAVDEYGFLIDDLAGHGIAAILDDTNTAR